MNLVSVARSTHLAVQRALLCLSLVLGLSILGQGEGWARGARSARPSQSANASARQKARTAIKARATSGRTLRRNGRPGKRVARLRTRASQQPTATLATGSLRSASAELKRSTRDARHSARDAKKAERRGQPHLAKRAAREATRNAKRAKTSSAKHSDASAKRSAKRAVQITKVAKRRAKSQASSRKLQRASAEAGLRAKDGAKGALVTKITKAITRVATNFTKKPWVVALVKTYAKISQATTRRLDGLQARAPPWLARAMSLLRTYSLPSMGGFMALRLKQDPKFLGGILAGSASLSYAVLPGAIVFGMDPVLSSVLNALTTPLTLGIIALREQHLRQAAGETISLYKSARAVFASYRRFAVERRANLSRVAAAATP